MSFSTFGFNDGILKALAEQGFTKPTAIQQQAIPLVLQGKDLLGSAPTGTGKTASYVLPLLQQLVQSLAALDGQRRAKRIRALVVAPTRELALQIEHSVQTLGQYLDIRSLAVLGGVDTEPQKQALIDGVDLVVATPGRLLDLLYQRALVCDELEYLVIDEADRMLDMGFGEDIERIVDRLPEQRQSLLFSATLPEQVRHLASSIVHHASEIAVEAQSGAEPLITQWVIPIDKDKKSALLSHLIKQRDWQQGLVFIRTKQSAAKLVAQLAKRDIAAECIHGGRSQAVREKLFADFKSGHIQFLIATGIAARGIDIEMLARVVNYDLPDDADDYIHRIGRTGRAGESGEAISLVSKDDFKRLCAIERRLEQVIPRQELEEFKPLKALPPSNLNYQSSRPATPKPSTKNKNIWRK